jgi:hypothetical protein
MQIGLMLSHALNRFCGAGVIPHGIIGAGLRVGLGGDICLHVACQHSSASCWCAWGAILVVSPSSQCCAGWCCRLSHGCHIWTIWREGMMWGVGVDYGEWRFAGSQEGSSVHQPPPCTKGHNCQRCHSQQQPPHQMTTRTGP